uniref:Uncharacterized protein n=1 Tax=viral metagenome TaxID=1070528 RepID=A0A6C0CBX3_9ZZZZ
MLRNGLSSFCSTGTLITLSDAFSFFLPYDNIIPLNNFSQQSEQIINCDVM